MKVHFKQGGVLDRLETDPDFDAALAAETVSMYRRRIQQLGASLDERDILRSRALDIRPHPQLGPDFFSISVCPVSRLVIHLFGTEPRRDVAILELIAVKQPVRRLK